MDMMSQFREQLAPVVIDMLKKISGNNNNDDDDAIIGYKHGLLLITNNKRNR
jgi:hypothetical protein